MAMAAHFEQWAEQYKQAGLQEGRREGQQKGRREGLQQGEALLLQRLLTRRFGNLPADLAARIETASVDQIEMWVDRFVTAATLHDVLRD